MLTYPSDPLPQIVCPMDEDAIPPHTFCSAPPQSEPPPPLLSLFSTTPSCSNNGTSSHRRSGRIKAQTPKKQSTTDSEAAQRPARQTRSPSKRPRDTGSMVQVSYPEQPRAESMHGDKEQTKEGCEFSFSAEQQNMRSHQRIKPAVSSAENVEEPFADTAQNFNTTRFAMEACEGLAVRHNIENPSDPKGWMIGPLFQSFKSKMASLTEIVMSPVKLFRASSPPPSEDHPEDFNEHEAAGTSDMELSKPSDVFHPVAHKETWRQDMVVAEGAQNTSPVSYSKKLSFDVGMSTTSECGAECSVTQTERNSSNSVPFQHNPSPLSDLLRPSVCVSSSAHESKIISSAEEQKGKLTVRLKTRKCTGSRRRIISKTLVSEVRKESELDVIDEVSHINLGHLNKAESHNGPSTSLSSSDCFFRCKDPPHLGGNDGSNIESCELVRPNIRNNLNSSAEVRTVKTQLNPATSSAGRVKREHKVDCLSQDSVKRKRLNADQRLKEGLSNVASDGGALTRKKVTWTNCGVERATELKPTRKGPAVLTRANKKEKDAQEMFTGGDSLNTQTDLTPVCSLTKDCVAAETSVEVKPSGSRRRLKTKPDLGRSDEARTDNRMDYSMNISQSKHEATPDALARPDVKQLQSLSTCMGVNKKPLKRKSPKQAASSTKSDIYTSSAAQLPSELLSTDSDAIQQEESRKDEPNQPSKRPRKRGANRSPTPAGNDETKIPNPHVPTKEKQCGESKQKMSVDPLYFEMTPSESPRAEPPLSQPVLDCYVKVSRMDEGSKESETVSVLMADEVFSTNVEASVNNNIPENTTENIKENISDPVLRSAARGVTCRPRRVDKQRRRCRVLHSRTRKGAEVTNSITMDDTDLTARSSQGGSSKSLLRSYSCPEIHSLSHHDAAWTSSLHSPQLSRTHTSHQHSASHSPFVHHIHKSPRRARRHTVCSLEVEREIAPLCLRKEVYPSRRSVPYDGSAHHLSPIIALSPTTSLKALATCFLSSPLAFLSKKAESRGATSSPSTSSPVFSSSSSSSSIHPLSPSTWRLPGFLQRSDSSTVPLDSSSSLNPLVCEIERRGKSEEENDGGDTSSSSQEFEDVALREEKSLSDSEIKVVKKLEERGKVSSIRIRKTLPKPQNNLTPMGLPKPIRLKKKEFSLEEIYTNKNFSKPPESRLETIFEVPLNRKNGSESWFGQRRLKRVLEFLEVGEARKPKKPLVGAGKAGNSSSRTRQGGFPKDETSLSPQDVDSLLCAKLDQLNLWLIHDQRDS